MIKIEDKSRCNGCYACYSICPQHCIEMKEDNEGFLYPMINQEKCTNCNKCENVCPILNNKTEKISDIPIGYAAYNKDETIRLKSSSGGIFSAFAQWILNQEGIVIGAAMTENCKSVHHITVDKIQDLEVLRGSKYIQSSIEDTYIKTKHELESGRKVLFTGTPCQVGGLLSYLGKDYENLYTQDLICHGVPSPLVWRKYAEMRETQYLAKLRQIYFRHKKNGWKKFSLSLKFSNGRIYCKSLDQDLFLRGFLQNLYLRPSCYNCVYKTINRQSDITLADFWGINQLHPEMDDDKGISFIWAHTEKGKQLIKSINDLIIMLEVPIEDAIKFNSAAVKSVLLNSRKMDFFNRLPNQNIYKLINQFVKYSTKQRIRCVLSNIKHKLLK